MKQMLAMPDSVAKLIKLSLAQMNLEIAEAGDKFVSCTLRYESGAALSIVVTCDAERKWLRTKTVLLVSAMTWVENSKAAKVHFRDRMDFPKGPGDLQFIIQLAAKVRAMAWALAATESMGECTSLPGRPPI